MGKPPTALTPAPHAGAPPPPQPRSLWRRALRHVPTVLGVLLLCGAIYVLQREFRSLRIADIRHALAAIPHHALLVSFGLTVAAYGILTFYDRLGTIYAGHPITHARAAFASFCAYALSHNLGFAAVSGAAVRYRLYSNWGLAPLEIGKVIAFCSLTFGLGAMTLGGSILLFEPRAMPWFGDHLPLWALYLAGVGLWSIMAAYVAVASAMPTFRLFSRTIELPHWRMALAQVLLATVDVAVTAGIVYALLPAAPGLTYARFLAVYLSSYTAGLVASLPGGLGVFDGALLFGLSHYLPAPTIVGAILVFRLYYYIIPLFLAGGMFAGNEIFMSGRGMLSRARTAAAPAVPAPSIAAAAPARWSEPDFAVAAGTGAVVLCGFLLLSLGVLENRPDFSWADSDIARVAAQAGEFVPSLMGAALLVLAAALSQRVNLAWGATVALLLVAAGFIAAQGGPFWVSGVLLLGVLMIAPYRSAFYRHARLLTTSMQGSVGIPLLTLMGCVVALALVERHVRWLGNESFLEVILSPGVPNSLRASVALAVSLAVGALWRLMRPGRVGWLPWDADTRRLYAALGQPPPARADGFVWGEAARAGIAFRREGRVLLGLGDPAGAALDSISAIWRLRDLAVQEGRSPAFWAAGPSLLDVYAGLGLTALPLGADGLPVAAGAGERGEVRRYLVCAAERDLSALLPLLPELAALERAGPRRVADVAALAS